MQTALLTRRDISRLKEGILPYALQRHPFIIMREKVSLLFTDNINWQWSIQTSPEKEGYFPVSREEALSIIKNFKMKEAYRNRSGQIYETDGNPFFLMYQKTNN